MYEKKKVIGSPKMGLLFGLHIANKLQYELKTVSVNKRENKQASKQQQQQTTSPPQTHTYPRPHTHTHKYHLII